MAVTFNTGQLSDIITYSNGNIGIGGAANASYKLAVTGTGNFTGALRTSSTFTSGDTIQLGLASTDGGFWTWGASNSFLVAATGKALNLNPNGASGTTGLSIATTGAATFSSNVGIGGVTLASWYTGYAAMQIGASASIFGNKTTSDTNTTQLANNAYLNTGATAWQYINTDEATRYEQVNGEHNFYSVASGSAGANITWGTPKLTIASTGNVGIGTTVPQYSLALPQDSKIGWNDAASAKRGSITVNSASDAMVFTTGTSDAERMRITSGGYVLIGTTTAVGSPLQVQGNTWLENASAVPQYLNRTGNDGGLVVFLKAGVQVGVIATNTYTLPSDANFKKNINTLDLGLNLVSKLRPVSYNHKIDDDDAALSTGFIAQELEQSLSELGVEKNKYYLLQHIPNEKKGESQYWVDYQKMIPVLVNAIKELSAKITALENK